MPRIYLTAGIHDTFDMIEPNKADIQLRMWYPHSF